MRYLLLSIIIISLVGILMVPNAFGNEIIVTNVPGAGTRGCEETNSCFNPNPVRININDRITWTNPDRAAHTVTSGNPTDGPDGYFDSSLMMAGGSYSKTFTSYGTYDYFCMVHPWREGTVIVSGGTSPSNPTSKTSTFLKLDSLDNTFKLQGQNSEADVIITGQLLTGDRKSSIPDAKIKLVTDGFSLAEVYQTQTTDANGKYRLKIILGKNFVGQQMSIQAVFSGGEKWANYF